MVQHTPRDDIQKAASEILKRVDQLIKAGEIDRSVREIIHAKETRRSLSKSAASSAPDSLHVNGFRKPTSKGTTTPKQPIGLQNEQRDPGTSSERQLQIDVPTRSDQKLTPGAETILVIDDDEQMLLLISQILTHHGYQVTSLTTSDEAYALLKEWKPRLILSDIDLKTSTMGGFSLYERIRELKHLHNVPFVFLTGLNDEILVRKGKELGVDDYLTKPVSEENLIAAVKGKLKRFRNLGGPS